MRKNIQTKYGDLLHGSDPYKHNSCKHKSEPTNAYKDRNLLLIQQRSRKCCLT